MKAGLNMVLSAQSIRNKQDWVTDGPEAFVINPFCDRTIFEGMSYGLSSAGYDIRIGMIDRTSIGDTAALEWIVKPSEFVLLSSLEYFEIPHDLLAVVHDKSSFARQGLALQNTVLEPGWKGHITLELSNHNWKSIKIKVGQPIAQVVFHQLDQPTKQPYNGKYQYQSSYPTHTKLERE